MKRDLELIRKIMLHLESMPAGTVLGQDLKHLESDGPRLAEHLDLLRESGFIVGHHNQADLSGSADAYVIQRIAGPGHDFIAATQNATVWAKTKERLAKVGGTVALGTVTEVASAVAKALLGLDP